MVDTDFVPETLKWCDEHYVPPVKRFITCEDFGHTDGMNGSCHWCSEMEPYQWHMCQDEDWVRGLLSPAARVQYETREDAIKFIEQYKYLHSNPDMAKSMRNKKRHLRGKLFEKIVYTIFAISSMILACMLFLVHFSDNPLDVYRTIGAASSAVWCSCLLAIGFTR